MDLYEQLKAFDWIESSGLALIGIFPSHPARLETASVTDIAEATYPKDRRIRATSYADGCFLL